MSPMIFVLFVFGFMFTVRAYPTGLNARQALADTSVPMCAVICASHVPAMSTGCVQLFTSCLFTQCSPNDYNVGVTFADGYCAGQGIVHIKNGLPVTDVPPAVTAIAATTAPQPASSSPTAAPSTVVVTEFVTLSHSTLETTTTLSTSFVPATESNAPAPESTASSSSSTVSTTSSSPMLRSPAAISVYIIITIVIIIIILLLARSWRRKSQGDFIIPTHRRNRGKSFLIDEASYVGRRRSKPESIELMEKPKPKNGDGDKFGDSDKFDLERPLPAVPIPTKDSSPALVPVALSYIPPLAGAIVHAPSRSYTALPGRAPTSPPPGLERPSVAQTFAAGRERAMTNIGHSRGASSSPSSPASSISTSSSADIYSAVSKSPLPAYTYQPVAPSPLRVQVQPTLSRVSTIAEEPRTPHSTAPPPSVFSSPPMSVHNSTVEKAQRGRPVYAAHVRNPRSAENLREFTFPMRPAGNTPSGAAGKASRGPRASLNDTELQITISEALFDGPPPSRSQTPIGSMHRGAGGSTHSVSGSISKVHGKLHALVGGMRRERD